MMISHVKFASIPVSDQDRALAFYTEKLGFVVTTDAPISETQRWIKLSIPDALTKIVLFTPDGQQDRIGTFSNIVFSTPNVEKTYEELKARGVEFLSPPQEEPWGTYAQFVDPDGNQFILSTADE